MILQQSILHNEDEKEQIRRDFDVFSIEEVFYLPIIIVK